MKKYLYFGCLTITSLLCLTSCNQHIDLTQLDVAHSYVYAKYEDKAIISYDTEFSLEGITFYDSVVKDNIVSTLVSGDKLNIYYSNSDVKHVFVDKASLVEIKISVAPGGDKIEMFTDESGIVINSSKIEYIIKNDSSFVPIDDYPEFIEFYGTYNPVNNIKTSEFTTLVQLEAIYSFAPR